MQNSWNFSYIRLFVCVTPQQISIMTCTGIVIYFSSLADINNVLLETPWTHFELILLHKIKYFWRNWPWDSEWECTSHYLISLQIGLEMFKVKFLAVCHWLCWTKAWRQAVFSICSHLRSRFPSGRCPVKHVLNLQIFIVRGSVWGKVRLRII